MKKIPRIIIAGVRGGSGKTMLTLSIICGLSKLKGLKVVPYKKGPDYIDPGWMSLAAGRPCYSLDTFIMPPEVARGSFINHFDGSIAVVEGNRGLHDGFDPEGSHSTAELAKLTSSPVILIIDCTKMTRTAAAVALGCMKLDPEVKISGVVLNRVSGSRHESVARTAVERYCGVPVVGSIPRLNDTDFRERHMGLVPHQEAQGIEGTLDMFLSIAKEHIDIDRIVSIASGAPDLGSEMPRLYSDNAGSGVKIGVIRDKAFQFYYPENLEALKRLGAELVKIDSMSSDRLPALHALYIGGGFPETNAIRLAKNVSFRSSVKEAAERGLPIYAECGGLMFLGRSIILEGSEYPMAGVFPVTFEMMQKPQAHGYTIAEVDAENPFYAKGTVLHGHEFHYSRVVSADERELKPVFAMQRGSGIFGRKDGLVHKNVFAAYTHVHALGVPQWAEGMIRAAAKYRKSDVDS
ncbi:MAG: hydrogenobyrinic acid a,c-diamide synthase (glutamine-hydrolyzing) [Nitrospiraceae bacterium]|nr:hydrogenobyrinic acid a,c-diamide synthase (glutamine-hydrolyzing) [Nitrospiraceae bacterium]